MLILETDRLVSFDGTTLLPFERYVVTLAQGQNITKAMAGCGRKILFSSNFNSFERRYAGQDLNGKTLCIYRHNAFGDHLMLSALPKYLKTLFPKARILLFGSPSIETIWRHNPTVEFCPGALPYSTAKACDYHLFLESMLECNSVEDQSNAYDDLFAFAGFNEVADYWKRPFVAHGDPDTKLLRDWKDYSPNHYFVYQWASGNPMRQYPERNAIALFEQLLDRFPAHSIVVVGDKPAQVLTHDRILNLTGKTLNFRQMIPIVACASCVICPDSSIGHLAAAFPEVPVVSLWGPFDFKDRARYYENHTPVTATGACPHSPCRTHAFAPVMKCKDASVDYQTEKHCAVMAAIKPESIVVAVKGSMR